MLLGTLGDIKNKKYFYSELNLEHIIDKNYSHAQKIV